MPFLQHPNYMVNKNVLEESKENRAAHPVDAEFLQNHVDIMCEAARRMSTADATNRR